MTDIELTEVSDFCFRIILDFEKIDLNKFLDSLSELGDVIFFNDNFYIWLSEKDNKRVLLKKVKNFSVKYKTPNLLVLPLIYSDIRDKNNFLEIFVNEHLTSQRIKELNVKKQQDLKLMLENIAKANKLLENEKEATNA